MTLRLRLTLLYSALFLVAGGALLAVTYVLLSRALPQRSLLGGSQVGYDTPDGELRLELPPEFARTLDREAAEQRSTALHQLLVQSSIGLLLTALVAVCLGWIMAGRVLRPLRHVVDAAHRLSPDNLRERIELRDADDEFRELADTFNAMLARLESGFAFQRRFAATASHELRTPLTVQRSAAEVALADPDPSADSMRRMAAKVIKATERQERLIESLLVLAHSQEGVTHPAPVDLARVAAAALEDAGVDGGAHNGGNAVAEKDGSDFRAVCDLRPSHAFGDQVLVERLAANLVDNAVRHNVTGGRIEVRTRMADGYAVLEVANDGPYVPPSLVGTLFEPFQRHQQHPPARSGRNGGGTNNGTRTSGSNRGVGLGLAIVAAVTSTHRGWINAQSRPDGGLWISVGFPAPPARVPAASAGHASRRTNTPHPK